MIVFRKRWISVVLFFILSIPFLKVWSQEDQVGDKGREIISNLGCSVCHPIDGHDTTVREEAPNLTFEGDKVRPEWLFDFLKKPYTIRLGINARMPNFRLTDEEALAIVEFIISLKNREVEKVSENFQFKGNLTGVKEGEGFFKLYKCQQCHSLYGQFLDGTIDQIQNKGDLATELSLVPKRLDADWVYRWIKDPQVIQEGVNMPSFFYSDGEPMIDDADRQIFLLRNYLLSIRTENNSDAYYQAKRKYPHVTPSMGRKLVVKLNCIGCHNIDILPDGKLVAPPLNHEGSRVKEEWLQKFLKEPWTIKPEYSIMGTEARMPNFRLTDEEVKTLAKYVKTALIDKEPPAKIIVGNELSTPLVEKAEMLFYEKYDCKNCHRLGLKAGGIGPILTDAGERLNQGWVFKFIKNPKYFLPTTRMPDLKVTDEDAKTLTLYILSPNHYKENLR